MIKIMIRNEKSNV